MGVVTTVLTLVKGKKKLKTLIAVPTNNFQSYSATVNSNDELEIVGADGNGVAFQQTLPAPANSIVLFDVSNHSFYAYTIQGEVNPNMQFVTIVREIV